MHEQLQTSWKSRHRSCYLEVLLLNTFFHFFDLLLEWNTVSSCIWYWRKVYRKGGPAKPISSFRIDCVKVCIVTSCWCWARTDRTGSRERRGLDWPHIAPGSVCARCSGPAGLAWASWGCWTWPPSSPPRGQNWSESYSALRPPDFVLNTPEWLLHEIVVLSGAWSLVLDDIDRRRLLFDLVTLVCEAGLMDHPASIRPRE